MVEVAQELGLAADAPLLPGHGTHVRDLARTGWTEWSRAAEAALDSIAVPGSPAIVAGLSLGSLLAAALAATRPDQVCALVLLATATRFMPFTKALPLWIVSKLGIPDFDIPKPRSDIVDPEARADHLAYGANPLHSTLEVMRAGKLVERDLLPRIRCPVFIAHGEGDGVCHVGNATRTGRRIGSTDKTTVLLSQSAHVITLDCDRERLRVALRRFLQRIAAAARPQLSRVPIGKSCP